MYYRKSVVKTDSIAFGHEMYHVDYEISHGECYKGGISCLLHGNHNVIMIMRNNRYMYTKVQYPCMEYTITIQVGQ